eukprot:5840286-Pyramimonas_sp.AAC.1
MDEEEEWASRGYNGKRRARVLLFGRGAGSVTKLDGMIDWDPSLHLSESGWRFSWQLSVTSVRL